MKASAIFLLLCFCLEPASGQTLAVREHNCNLQLRNPKRLSACVNLGWYLHLHGQNQRAIDTLTQVTRLAPKDEKAFNALGVIYLFTADYPKAVAVNRAALQIQPNNEIAHYNLSLALWELGQFAEAQIHAQDAARLEPTNPHPWIALSIAEFRLGHLSAAQSAYRQAFKLKQRYQKSAYLEKLRSADFSPRQIAVAQTILKTFGPNL
ncbi:MAG: tetratricopeptide repeat protein [Anaerolineae bacterium]|nr:tetratricopeptide repeat protein [Gloeobacterales cyanobacterium ES-bin-313]